MNSSPIRKVFQGVADRHQMFRMFDRHAQRPNRWADDAVKLYSGEWFEIDAAEHDYMLNILPPQWMRDDMFAMREFLVGSVTSIFFSLRISGTIRFFHGYCDISEVGSPARMRSAILEREARPAWAMTLEERLEHIWSSTHDDYRGYAGERWDEHQRGKRTVMVYVHHHGATSKLLDNLNDAEIAAKLPVHLRNTPDAIAA